MDVIGAHARRLPRADERWIPRPYARAELEDGLLAGGIAGVATHPLDNVRGNILMLIDQDPDKSFGLTGLPGALTFEEILAMVGSEAGVQIDPGERYGQVLIAASPIVGACEAAGDRLVKAAASGERVVVATGHPIGLGVFYHELGRLLEQQGAVLLTPARGDRWRQPGLRHDWFIDYHGATAVLTDGREPRHTHWPDAMERILAVETPDLVVADHGFAGAAIEAGVETLSIADVNDPALIVAKAQGRTETVIVMDDHVAPDAYWPCFQAIAGRFDAR